MPWLDAAWHPAGWVDGPIPFDASDRGLLLGDGVFDTSLVLGGHMVFRAAHLARLASHARVLGFVVEHARLDAAVDGALARLNGGHGALRMTLTRGPSRRGLAPPSDPRPTILAATAPLATQALFAPLTLHPVAIRRNETSPLSRVKSLCYGDAVMAAAEALAAGCGDALFLNGAGRVACTGAGNLFALFGAVLATPAPEEGILDGVTRAVVLRVASTIGLAPTERALTPADLRAADAVVCTSSLRLVAPVVALNELSLAHASRAKALQALVADAVFADAGVDPRSLKAPA